MFQENGIKRRRTSSSSMSDPEDSPSSGVRLEENRDHGMKVLSGLNHLKKEKVLCDVALIAEGKTIQRKLYIPHAGSSCT